MAQPTSYDIVVVGGGFCGCYALRNLRKEGFLTHMFEAGAGLGGVWHWNAYPGARVDFEAPFYQFTSPDTWVNYKWEKRFPGRQELCGYFNHLDETWDLSRDVSYNSRVTAMKWDEGAQTWNLEINNGDSQCTARHVVLCTGFASKPLYPSFKNAHTFRGEVYHTSKWPQGGVKLDGRRVAIIGTGASGIQVSQEAAKVASQMTVFQRTANMALPMGNSDMTEVRQEELGSRWPEIRKTIEASYTGCDMEWVLDDAKKCEQDERYAFYEKLYQQGGLRFWLATYIGVLFDEELNDEAYRFWRSKVLPRINNRAAADILAPKVPPHPFGTKRVSLEGGFFELFDRPNVDLVNLRENSIAEFVPEGIKMSDGKIYNFDVIVCATGFDAVTGGITQMNIQGADGQYIKSKWEDGVSTYLGMTTSNYPNMFFTYGPQSPCALSLGPMSAEIQGNWVTACVKYLRDHGYTRIEPTRQAEEAWRKDIQESAGATLFPKADSWYYGANVPGKPREMLIYVKGWGAYNESIWQNCANKEYEGFILSGKRETRHNSTNL